MHRRISSVRSQSCPILWDCMYWSTPGFPVYHKLPELAQTHVHQVGDALQPSHPLSSPSPLLPSVFPSIRVFSNELTVCIRWPKYWSFSFSISPSDKYSGLSFSRIDWLDLLAVQGDLLWHHSLKASILWCSAFFYGPTLTFIHDQWKNLALTVWTFVSKIMSAF